jgi:hypothetical protein
LLIKTLNSIVAVLLIWYGWVRLFKILKNKK